MTCGGPWALCLPVLQFLGGLVATVFLDIVHISIFYPTAGLTDTGRFGAGMAILSLLLKPFSCCLVYHMYRERGGELLPHTGEATTSGRLPHSPLAGQVLALTSSHVSSVSALSDPQPHPVSRPHPVGRGLQVQRGPWHGH